MRNKTRWLAAVALILSVLAAGTAQALPALQLDILGGTYDSGSETIMSASGSFDVYAYLTLKNGVSLADTYYLSAAVAPQVGTPQDLGSFMFNGTNVSVTSGMAYGSPPLNDVLGPNSDTGDLQSHSIFDTYYTQLAFTFNANVYVDPYNTQDTRLSTLPGYNGGDRMYYAVFSVDTANLNPDYQIHFDLFNESLVFANNGRRRLPIQGALTDVDVNKFAPFSHDAQSNGNHQVPEPGTLLLLGTGLIGLGLMRRRKPVL